VNFASFEWLLWRKAVIGQTLISLAWMTVPGQQRTFIRVDLNPPIHC
jgi:hypothetical protein